MVTRADLPLLVAAIEGGGPPPTPGGATFDLVLDAAVVVPQAHSPMIHFGDVVQGLAVRVLRLPDMREVAFLDPSSLIDASWQVQVNDVGSGSVTIPLDMGQQPIYDGDDPVYDGGEPLVDGHDIAINDVLWFEVDGEVVAASLVEQIDEHTMDEQGPGAHTLTASGRGVGAVLEWCITQPANGVDRAPVERDRLYSWPSPQYDDSGWGWSKVVDLNKTPEGFPWPDLVPWMAGPTATDDFAPGGSTYFRSPVWCPGDLNVIVYLAIDNWGTLWVDGQMIDRIGGLTPVGAVGTWARTYTFQLSLSAGEHIVGITMYNQGHVDPGQPTSSEGGVKLLMLPLLDNGQVDPVVMLQSGDGWRALEEKQSRVLTPNQAHYQPGMTCGEAVGIFLDEGQERGAVPFIRRGFTDLVDANGRPWGAAPNLSTKTGNDLLTFVQEMSVPYVDWQVDPDLTLSLWRKGEMGEMTGHHFAPAPVNDPSTGELVLLDRKRT